MYNQFGFSLEYIEYLIYFQVALVIAFVDWKHLIIPNNVLFVGFALILGIRLFDNSSLVLDQILFGLTSFIFVLLIMFLGNYFLKRESMGMGDVKLSGFIGFVLGLPLFLVALWIASVFGSFYGIVNKIQGKQSTKIPFGAILISVSVVEMLYRKHIEEFFNTWIS
ncbi:MAG: A24 family peptidase [Bacteroidota bacterium]